MQTLVYFPRGSNGFIHGASKQYRNGTVSTAPWYVLPAARGAKPGTGTKELYSAGLKPSPSLSANTLVNNPA